MNREKVFNTIEGAIMASIFVVLINPDIDNARGQVKDLTAHLVDKLEQEGVLNITEGETDES